MRSLGDRIATKRKAANLNQDQLSEMVNVSQAHISRIESDTDKPSFALLERIAEALACELEINLRPIEETREQSSSSSSLTLQQPAAPPRSREIPYFGGDILTLLSLAREKIKAQAGTLTPDEREAVGMLLSLCARHLDGDEEQGDHLGCL